jgi:cytochrome c
MRANLLYLLLSCCLLPLVAAAAPIHDAIRKGDVAAVAAALISGANVNETDGPTTPLYLAISKGNLEVARLLIKRGADLNFPAKFGTPLYAAAKFGHAEIVELLLASGAKPNQTTRSLTALHMATGSGCLDCVIHLVGSGADVNALTSARQPAIHFAKLNGHGDIVAFLHDHGAEKLTVPPITSRLSKADADVGKQVFSETCGGCHILAGEINRNKAPNLWGIVGRSKATDKNFQYSPAFQEEIGTWTYEALNIWLSDPARAISGTAMDFPGLQDEKQRADVIAFLRTLSDNPLPPPVE